MTQLNNRIVQVAPVAERPSLCKQDINSLGDTIAIVAPYFRPYIELLKFTGGRYYFRKDSTSLRDDEGNKRNWHPLIEHRLLREFHTPNEGILYMALPQSVNPSSLKPGQLLYIGCSASGGARFWRGKQNATTRFPSAKSCFHHEQMRREGTETAWSPIFASRVPSGYNTLTNQEIEAISRSHQIALPSAKYPAHGLEKRILSEGFTKWAWNKPAAMIVPKSPAARCDP